jgi:TonB family protein
MGIRSSSISTCELDTVIALSGPCRIARQARVVGLVGAIALATSALAIDQVPQEWQGALDLRTAITIKSEHVAVRPAELAAAGVDAGTFTPPKRVKGSSPSYPEAAARDGAQGTVLVECLISTSGAVEACRVSHSVHPAVDRAAVNAIRRWRYEPARVTKQPRSIVARFMMIFRLQ